MGVVKPVKTFQHRAGVDHPFSAPSTGGLDERFSCLRRFPPNLGAAFVLCAATFFEHCYMGLNLAIAGTFTALFGSVLGLRAQPHKPVPAAPVVDTRESTTPHPAALRRVPSYQKPPLAIVPSAKAADLLIAFMNGEGKTGCFTASEVDDYWLVTAEMHDLEPLDCRFVREALDGKGLKVGQKRLNTPEYLAVRQRTGKGRAVLYRIPRCRAQAGQETDVPAHYPAKTAETRPASGHRPASAEISNAYIRVA